MFNFGQMDSKPPACTIYRSLLAALLVFPTFPLALAQGQSSRAPLRAQCKFPDGKNITVEYFSLGMNGRKIFGDTVPYDQVWRTGANQTTTFVTTTDVMVGGKNVPAGRYTVFTIPDLRKWTLILNKRSGELDLPYTYEASELVRIDLLLRPIASPVENFTIAFDQRRAGCVLNLRWERSEASTLIAEAK